MQLGARVLEHILGFHREAAEHLTVALVLTEPFEDIRRALHLNCKTSIGFLYLLVRSAFGSVICDSGGLDDDIRVSEVHLDGFKHILSARNIYDSHKRRRVNTDGAADKSYLGASEHGLTRHGVAHLACGVICDKADRVNTLSCRARCDENPLPCQILLLCGFAENIIEQNQLGRHFTCSRVSAGEVAVVGRNDCYAELLKRFYIALNNGICEHIHVHRGRHYNGAFHCEIRRAEHIVGDSVRHLCYYIRRCGCNKHYVRLVGNGNVSHVIHEVAVEGVGHALVFCERFKGDRVDKIRRILRHYHVNVGVQLNKTAREIRDFIRCDTARNAENNCFSF